MPPLSEVAIGTSVTIADFSPECPPAVRQRLASLGFNNEATVSKVRRAPLGDPSIYQVMGYQICLRNQEARHIHCEVDDDE